MAGRLSAVLGVGFQSILRGVRSVPEANCTPPTAWVELSLSGVESWLRSRRSCSQGWGPQGIKASLPFPNQLMSLLSSCALARFIQNPCSMTNTWGPGSTELMTGMDLFNRIGYNFVAYSPSWCLRWSVKAAAMLAMHAAIPVTQGQCPADWFRAALHAWQGLSAQPV